MVCELCEMPMLCYNGHGIGCLWLLFSPIHETTCDITFTDTLGAISNWSGFGVELAGQFHVNQGQSTVSFSRVLSSCQQANSYVIFLGRVLRPVSALCSTGYIRRVFQINEGMMLSYIPCKQHPDRPETQMGRRA